MKVSDLMVGDWVICNHYQDKPFIKQFGVADFAKGEYEFCEPITLTEEILVKNGFTYNKEQTESDIQSVYHHFTKFYDFPLGRGFYIEHDTEDDIYWITDHCWIKVNYVHQLQHLLRLCGIDKEIEL